jgi:hypothetical protein
MNAQDVRREQLNRRIGALCCLVAAIVCPIATRCLPRAANFVTANRTCSEFADCAAARVVPPPAEEVRCELLGNIAAVDNRDPEMLMLPLKRDRIDRRF